MPYLDKTGLTKLWSKIKAVFAKKEHGTYYVVGNTSGTDGTWTGSNSDITSLYNGLTVAYKIGIKGASTTTLNINGLGAKTVKRNDGNLTTHIPVNSVVILVYDGTYWRWADYDNNSQVRVYRQTSGYNSDYPILVSRTAKGSIGTAGSNSTYSNVYAVIGQNGTYTPTINPHTGAIKAQTFTEGGKLLSEKYALASAIPTTLPASDVYAWAKAATKPSYTYSEVGAAASSHNHDSVYAAKSHSHSEYALAADVSSMSNSIANLNTTVNSLAKTTTTIYSTETQITSPAQGAVTTANFTFSSSNSLQAKDRIKVYFAGAPSSGASTSNAFQAGIVEFEVFQSGGYIVGSGSFMSNTGAQTVIISAQVVSSTQMKVSVWGLSANSYAAYGQVYLLKVERLR